MWPDSRFAQPRGSFLRPVLPPLVDPDASPNTAVTIACEWLPYIRGALMQLLLQTTWDTDAAGLTLVQQRVFNLIDLFQECSTSTPPFSCLADLTTGPSPVGSWSVGCVGSYSSGVGYDSTLGMCGGSFYEGVDVSITLPAPVVISYVAVTYSVDPEAVATGVGYDLVFVYDVTNSAFIGTPLMGPLTHTVFGTYNSGPTSLPTSVIRLFVASGAQVGSFVPTGAAQIGPHVRITGTASLPPC